MPDAAQEPVVVALKRCLVWGQNVAVSTGPIVRDCHLSRTQLRRGIRSVLSAETNDKIQHKLLRVTTGPI